jgi:hypothetical protein
MPKTERYKIIEELQKERGSLVITYITSTRLNFEAQIAFDAIRIIYDHLILNNANKNKTKIDLFLHSNGGDSVVPWRLVTLLREYCKKLTVLIPHKAYSAATLIALGADEIIMHPMGIMGPVDPTVTNIFNPTNPANPNQILGISVEDVSSYINLIKEDVGIHHEDELIQAFNILANKVHPLALGNVKRFMVQSRMMAKKLLELHMGKSDDEHKINDIVDNLTSKLYYHAHPINRNEAKSLGLKVIKPPILIENLLWKLYLEYEAEMLMDKPFMPLTELFNQDPNFNIGMQINDYKIVALPLFKSVYIESLNGTNIYTNDLHLIISRTNCFNYQTNFIIKKQAWEIES